MSKRLGLWLLAALTAVGIAIAPYIQPPWILSLIVLLLTALFSLIHKTRYPAIALSVIAVLYGLGILSLFVFAGTLSIVVMGEVAFRLTGERGISYVAYIVVGFVSAFLTMLYLGSSNPFVIITGVLVGSLLKSALGGRRDTLLVEHLGVAMTMFLFDEINFPVDDLILLTAVVIALSIGYFSYRMRVADLSGLFSASLVGILLIVFADVRWFLIMLTFLILGSICTRFRFERKKEMGVAESHGGVRGYFNVFANGLVAVSAAILYGITTQPMYLALFLGSVASAAADTVASEIGVVGNRPVLITTFKEVAPGTNGGITLGGEIAALIAAVCIGLVALILNIADPWMVMVTIAAGFVGTNVDSIVGATLENSGKIGNSGTNLIATLSGGIFALSFFAF